MQATQRTYTDVETGYNCRLYTSHDASKFYLIYEGQPNKIADGSQVNSFFICSHTDVTIKTNFNKEIYCQRGTFYHLKEGEKVTHKKYIGFKRFTKI